MDATSTTGEAFPVTPPAASAGVQPGVIPAGYPISGGPADPMSRSNEGAVLAAPPAAAAETRTDAAAKRRAERIARKANRRKPQVTRRARLRLIRLDPWSVMKTSFLLSIAFGIMCVVAVFLVYSFITAAGLWDNINSTVNRLLAEKASDKFDITQYVTTGRVMGITMLVAAVDVVLITALATLGAFIYNLSATLLGGIDVTLAEDQK